MPSDGNNCSFGIDTLIVPSGSTLLDATMLQRIYSSSFCLSIHLCSRWKENLLFIFPLFFSPPVLLGFEAY